MKPDATNTFSLDILSNSFDPQLALHCSLDAIQHLDALAPAFDNIAQWRRAMIHAPVVSSSNSNALHNEPNAPHSIEPPQKRQKIHPNVGKIQVCSVHDFKAKLHKIGSKKGPFSTLYDAWQSQAFVTIILKQAKKRQSACPNPSMADAVALRTLAASSIQSCANTCALLLTTLLTIVTSISLIKSSEIRGFIIARILAFDKHFNLVLGDMAEFLTHRSAITSMTGLHVDRSRRRRTSVSFSRSDHGCEPSIQTRILETVMQKKLPLYHKQSFASVGFLRGSQIVLVNKL